MIGEATTAPITLRKLRFIQASVAPAQAEQRATVRSGGGCLSKRQDLTPCFLQPCLVSWKVQSP